MIGGIVNGTIEDVINNLDLIREKIPRKKSITDKDIKERLQNKHGVKIVKDKMGEILGLTVWYEVESSLYLWIGAYKESGKGIGSVVLRELLESMPYNRAFVKISRDNEIASRHLAKLGFKPYQTENNLIFLEYVGN